MRRTALSVLLLVVGCAGEIDPGDVATEVAADDVGGAFEDVVPGSAVEGEPAEGEATFALASDARKIVFLNGRGGTYRPGNRNEPENGLSTVVANQVGAAVRIPAAPWNEATWRGFVDCVKQDFARFDVEVVDQRPAQGPYIEVAVGGRSSLLNYERVVRNGAVYFTAGVSPWDYQCRPYSRSVAFVFAEEIGNATRACSTTSHEIGHSLGLEHEYLAADPMTYLPYSGDRAFQDQNAWCGTGEPVRCRCGGGQQNTVQHLVTKVGRRSTTEPPKPPSTDTSAPRVTILAPAAGSTHPERSPLQVRVQAEDNVGVTDVRLYWEFTNRMLPCDDSVAGSRCVKSGNTYTWTLDVGTGSRTFYVVAADGAGNRAQTPARTIQLGAATPPPPATPTVTLESPADGAVARPGEAITFRARVANTGAAAVGQVTLKWARPAYNDATTFAMTQVSPGVYERTLTVSATAPAGARVISVSTTVDGQQVTAPERTVQIQK